MFNKYLCYYNYFVMGFNNHIFNSVDEINRAVELDWLNDEYANRLKQQFFPNEMIDEPTGVKVNPETNGAEIEAN